MNPRTILHTIETAGPGGAETIVLELATRLDPARFRSVALVPRQDWLWLRLRERGVPTYVLEGKSWHDLEFLKRMAGVVRKEQVDLIHSHLPDQNFFSCLVGRWTGRKTVATYHGVVELRGEDRRRAAIKRWWVRHSAAAVVSVCDHVARLLEQDGFPKRKLRRIYNGIDAARYASSANGHLRRELGLPAAAPVVGMVANLRPSKGHEYFIRAARQVAAAVPEARFVAAGDTHPRLIGPIRRLLAEMNLEERFVFLGFRSDVADLLAAIDVFVLPSTSEGFPLATLEAMAAGKPLVATRTGGTDEIVVDGETGYLVPPADAGALAARILDLLNDPARAAAFGRRGRERVYRHFTLAGMAKEYEKLYGDILEAR